jgi:RNA polymerase sigma factor (TIGR02999 family)
MRQVLVDHARAHSAAKRGGGVRPLTLQESLRLDTASPDEVLALDIALDRLDEVDPRLRHVVELRYFGGMKDQEVAQLLDVSERTVRTYWARARAWLHRELTTTERESSP